jgi:Tim10/DDP family zinc finger
LTKAASPTLGFFCSSISKNFLLMSWFGGSGGKSDNNGGGSYQPENSYQDQSFVGQQESYSAPRAAAGSAESFQQELLLEQQKALIQAVMFKLTEIAFKKCITTPATSLSSCKISRINPPFNYRI